MAYLTRVELSNFCRRIGISVNAGLPLVESIKREAHAAGISRAARECWTNVATAITNGSSFTEAVRGENRRLDPMFLALIEVAERSGRLGETLLDMADDYDRMVKVVREFRNALAMPIFELAAALVVIGIAILAMGFVQEITGESADLLGLGLVGSRGLQIYLFFLTTIAVLGAVAWHFIRQGTVGSRVFHKLLAKIPKVGRLMKTLAQVRLARSLYLTLRTGMDMLDAVSLSFDAATFAPISDQKQRVLQVLREGGTMDDAFSVTRGLDFSLLQNINVGEHSGNTPELMSRTAEVLLQEAVLLLKQLSVIGFFCVFGLVAVFIIFFIFRIFSFYISAISGAGGM